MMLRKVVGTEQVLNKCTWVQRHGWILEDSHKMETI